MVFYQLCHIKTPLCLLRKTLALSPDRYNYIRYKRLGAYKQGKYKDARETLQKSWDLRKEQAVFNYNHEANLHLEAAKKAAWQSKE
jgi:hypothetical protein